MKIRKLSVLTVSKTSFLRRQ